MTPRTTLLALLLALLMPMAISARAQPVPAVEFWLDNGLQVVVIEDRRAPVVTHMLWYRVGSADEERGKTGLAHFLEHMMFRGTSTRPDQDFSAIVEAEGGDDNAFTSFDYTAYFQRVASDRLGLMMALEADRMVHLAMNPDLYETERGVILEERNQRVDSDPGGLLNEQRRAMMYLAHPYGQPIIGWREDIERLTLDDALDFYRRHYAPDNAVLVVAGDVSPDEVLALAALHYGPIAPAGTIAPRLRQPEPPAIAERRLTLRDARVGAPYMIRIYRAPARKPGDQADAAALSMLADVLGGGGITSVIGAALQVDDPVAVSTGAFYAPVALDDTTFGVFLMPGAGIDAATAEASLDAVLADFLRDGPDPDDLARARVLVTAAEVYAMDSQQGLAQTYGAALASGLGLADVAAWPDDLRAVDEDAVLAAARAILRPENSVTAWLVPLQGEDK